MQKPSENRQKWNYFQRPVPRAACGEIPILSYGFTDILAKSPDFEQSVSLQAGNDSAMTKIHPKKSWDISDNTTVPS